MSTYILYITQLISNSNQGDNVDENGIHTDVHIQSIGDTDDDDTGSRTLNKTRPTADTEHFFKPIPQSAKVQGDKKKRVKCISCAYVLIFYIHILN